MPDAFQISVPTASVELAVDRTGEIVADVTSGLNRNTRVRIEVLGADGADPAWFGPPDPAEYDSQVHETRQIRVPIVVGSDTAAGPTSFRLRASAVDNPGADYTESAAVVVDIPPAPEQEKIPTWLIALVAGIVLAVVGGGLWLLLRGSDDDIATVVGERLSVAADALGDGVTRRIYVDDSLNGANANSDGCVLLQTPFESSASDGVALLVTRRPIPYTQLPPLPVLDDLTASTRIDGGSQTFADEVISSFGPVDGERWETVLVTQVQVFADRFLVDGEPAPQLISLVADGGEAFEGVEAVSDSGGAPGGQCVLVQFPPPEEVIPSATSIVAVTTACPGEVAFAPQAVTITTPMDLTTFSNLCDVVSDICDAIRADPIRGAEFIGSEAFVAMFDTQVQQFRLGFSNPSVPGLTGKSLGSARTLLGMVDLALVEDGTSAQGFCRRVESQFPAPGTPIDDVPGAVVVVVMELSPSQLCFHLQADAAILGSIVFEDHFPTTTG